MLVDAAVRRARPSRSRIGGGFRASPCTSAPARSRQPRSAPRNPARPGAGRAHRQAQLRARHGLKLVGARQLGQLRSGGRAGAGGAGRSRAA